MVGETRQASNKGPVKTAPEKKKNANKKGGEIGRRVHGVAII